ncbi:DUF3099 domain-containing protein [Actinomadura yumaensis]|uniref:DUF3099 domain-containing protein n=1 Tax=Actinomadura yumaensis TaxID=111807 RepID=A0ABW2CUT0_9ACTN
MKRRRIAYAIMMGSCLTLFVLAWAVVRRFSPPAAVAMSVAAMLIPPFAAIVANWGIDRPDRDEAERDAARRDRERGGGPGGDGGGDGGEPRGGR